MMHRTVAAALVAVLALGIASCGGSEPTLTRAQLTRRIEVACRQGQAVTQKQAKTNANRGSTSDFIGAALAGQQAIIDRLDDLNPSASAKADYEKLKGAFEQRAELFKKLQDVDASGLRSAMEAATPQAEKLGRRIESASQGLELLECR